MIATENRRGRPGEGSGTRNPGKKITAIVVDSAYKRPLNLEHVTPVIDLLTLTPRDREVWDAAYLSGYLLGHEAGAKWADERAASLHREAVRIVRAMAGIEPRDPQADRTRAAEREARCTA